MHSQLVQTQDLLLKITVPKRTGRKRKRGSDDPFRHSCDAPSSSTAANPGSSGQPPAQGITEDGSLIRSMRDNPERTTIDPVGLINQTHRFRSLPDFVQSTADSPFMQKLQETILPFDFQKMKEFKLDMSKGIQTSNEIIPPPRWSQAAVPFQYAYRQNPGVSTVVDRRGNLHTENTQIAPRSKTQEVAADALQVPTGPSPDLPSISTLEPALQRSIAEAKKLLRSRPVFTRRALGNCIPGEEWRSLGLNVTKYLFQYIGYTFNGGAYQKAIIRFGFDPRAAPDHRIYQTFIFMFEPRERYRRRLDTGQRAARTRTEQELRRESHLFDGVNVSRDGKIWQVCDVTDPVLREVLATENLREKCHVEGDGWYHHGTVAKVRTIMKHKIHAALKGTQPLSDASYAKVAFSLPDLITKDNRPFARLTGEGASSDEIALVNRIRTLYHSKELADDAREDTEDENENENENADENDLEDLEDLGSD